MTKVFIPQEVADTGTDFLEEHGYGIVEGRGLGIEEMKSSIADCEAMLIRTAECPRELIEAGKQLKIIARHGVGYDNVDIQAAAEQGIWVTNTPLALTDSVAEYSLAALLMAAKNILPCNRAMKEDYWYKNSHKGVDLLGKTLGIVGFGRIGRAVAAKASAGLGMKVIAFDPALEQDQVPEYVDLCSWNELFTNADFVSLHLPGGESNRGVVGQKEFAIMKRSAVLLNMARGEVLDEKALNNALNLDQLRCAVLDVQSHEPPPLDWVLYNNEKVITTPHMASNTEECMKRMALHAASQIHKVLSGDMPDWPVNNPQIR